MGSIALDHNPQNTYSDNPLNVFWIWFSWAVVITFLFLLVSTLIEGLIRLRRRIRKHASASDDALTKPKKPSNRVKRPKKQTICVSPNRLNTSFRLAFFLASCGDL